MARRGTPWFHSRRRFCVPAAWDQPWANRLRRARPVVCRLAMPPPVFAREWRCVFPVGRCVDLVRRNRGRKELPCWFERRPCRPYYMHGVQAAKQLRNFLDGAPSAGPIVDGFGTGGYLAAFNPDMTPDASFGTSHTGIVTTDVGYVSPSDLFAFQWDDDPPTPYELT